MRPGRAPGLLAGPMALLAWIRTRRSRKEAAAMLQQFKALLGQLVVLLEEVRAGKSSEPNSPQCAKSGKRRRRPRRGQADSAGAWDRGTTAETAPLRFCAPAAATIPDRGERRETQRPCQAPDGAMIAELPPSRGRRARPVREPGLCRRAANTAHPLASRVPSVRFAAQPPHSGAGKVASPNSIGYAGALFF